MEAKAKEALKPTIEEWEWLKKTGLIKNDWPGWKENGGPHADDTLFGCFLCQYMKDTYFPEVDNMEFAPARLDLCAKCPYHKKFGSCMGGESYIQDWEEADWRRTPEEAIEERKRLAGLIVAQLRELESEQVTN